jgi:hypothetical protein
MQEKAGGINVTKAYITNDGTSVEFSTDVVLLVSFYSSLNIGL